MLRSSRRHVLVSTSRTLAALVAMALTLLASSGPILAAAVEPEVSPAAQALLTKLNTESKDSLLETEGLSAESVQKILAHRSSGRKFENLYELSQVTGIPSAGLEALLAPFQRAEEEKARTLARSNAADGPSKRFSGRKMAGQRDSSQGEDTSDPGVRAEGQGPIGSVRPGYYGDLPGFDDLDKLDPSVKKAFLERVNRELCPCGCKNETIAYCLVNDPGCPVVKARARKIYDDVTKGKSE